MEKTDNKYNQDISEKALLISEILEKNQKLKELSSKTNGELSVEEILSNYPDVEELLESGENIKYIAYKKSKMIKFSALFVFIVTFCYGIASFSRGIKGFRLDQKFLIFMLLTFFTICIYPRLKDIFILTNKSFILGRKNHKSIKINYKDLEYIDLAYNKNNITYSIKDAKEKNKIINISKQSYKGTIHSEILTAISEKIELPKNKKLEKIKQIKILTIFVVLSALLSIFCIYKLPYMREVEIFGYSPAAIASIFIIISTAVYLKAINSYLKKEA